MMKTNRKFIALALAIILIVGAIIYLDKDRVVTSSSNIDAPKVGSSKELSKIIEGVEYPLSPELAGISGYLNTKEQTKISDFEGKVVLIDFWTYTCINCIRTLPYLTSWDKKYRDNGLVIIGVHSPEFEFEKEKENVQNAIDRYQIEYPVVQDNERGTWSAFNNRYWPAKYLLDADGYIRYVHFGEGDYEETELKIQELLKEAGYNSSTKLTEENYTLRNQVTPELYAGALFALARGQYIGNKKTIEVTEDYVLPDEFEEDTIYLEGLWTYNADNLQLDGENGQLTLKFTASEANIVASPFKGDETILEILIDGKYIDKNSAGSDVQFDNGKAFVVINEDRLYNIYKGSYGKYRLDLKVSEGFSFNAFTFG